MLCKTEAALNNTSEKTFEQINCRGFVKRLKSAKIILLEGTVMQMIQQQIYNHFHIYNKL